MREGGVRLFAAALALALCAPRAEASATAAAPGAAAAGRTPVIAVFGAVLASEAPQLQSLVGTIDLQQTSLSTNLLVVVQDLNLSKPDDRGLLAPIKAALSLARTPEERKPEAVVTKALSLVDAEIRLAKTDAAAKQVSIAGLENALHRIDYLAEIAHVYRPGQVKGLDKAAEAGHQKLVNLKQDAANGIVRGGAGTFGDKDAGEPAGPERQRAAEAELIGGPQAPVRAVDAAQSLADELVAQKSPAEARDLLEVMTAMGVQRQDEGVQRVLLKGVRSYMDGRMKSGSVMPPLFLLREIEALASVGAESKFDNVREIALEATFAAYAGVSAPEGGAPQHARWRAFRLAALEAVETLGAVAFSKRVKDLARTFLRGRLAEAASDADRASISERIKRLEGSDQSK
ncbi:MAG: hypothetical protein HY078_13045 [Elusimicrobia bacterium]|nr:hypothetical protein [Elusimicrobiota bacterium]